MRQPTDADRYLVARIETKAHGLAGARVPDEQAWNWRYKGPAADPHGPDEGAVDGEIVYEVSSLADLERLGWVWRGTRASDMRSGWGLTYEGEKAQAEAHESGDVARWGANARWWRELLAGMSEMARERK